MSARKDTTGRSRCAGCFSGRYGVRTGFSAVEVWLNTMSRFVSVLYGSFRNATYQTLGMQAPLPIPGVSDPVRIQLLRFLNDSI